MQIQAQMNQMAQMQQLHLRQLSGNAAARAQGQGVVDGGLGPRQGVIETPSRYGAPRFGFGAAPSMPGGSRVGLGTGLAPASRTQAGYAVGGAPSYSAARAHVPEVSHLLSYLHACA